MDKIQQAKRISAIREYLAGIGHPIGTVQGQEVLARALGLKNKHLLGCLAATAAGPAASAAPASSAAVPVRALCDKPLTHAELRDLGWRVDVIVGIPLDMLGDTEAINDEVSQSITGSVVGLEDIGFVHTPEVSYGPGYAAFRVTARVTHEFASEADDAEGADDTDEGGADKGTDKGADKAALLPAITRTVDPQDYAQASDSPVYVDSNGFRAQIVERTGSEVRFCAQGGGFVLRMPASEFDELFRKAALPCFEQVEVWADWLPPSLKLAAFSNGDRWNGFAVPYFPLESAQELAKHMPGLRYDAARDAFLIEEEGDEGACGVFEVCTLEVDGSAVKAYPIGAGAWCWHLAVG